MNHGNCVWTDETWGRKTALPAEKVAAKTPAWAGEPAFRRYRSRRFQLAPSELRTTVAASPAQSNSNPKQLLTGFSET